MTTSPADRMLPPFMLSASASTGERLVAIERAICVSLVLVLFAAITLCGCARGGKPKSEPPKPQTIAELQKAIAVVLAKYHVPGVGIAIVAKDRVIWAGGVGKADLAANRDVTADTMFRVGSITKSFVALSILRLREEGKVHLNAPVRDLAPEVNIVNPWSRTDPVRLMNLLEHTSGFDDMSLTEFYDMSGGPEVPLVKTFERFPEPQIVRWRPGTLQSYSNPGFGLAGYAVEKITRIPCEDYIADNILRPLGMTHSNMRLTPEVKAALAQGYEGNPPYPIPYYPIFLRPAGEMKSSPAEMARFVRMVLNRGTLDGVKIVSPASIIRMETPETGLAARAGLKYGYALGNYANLGHAIVMHGHDGGIDGFLSEYDYIPEQGLGYFFSINSSSSGAAFNEVSDLVFAFTTRGVATPPKPPAVALDSKIADRTGYYEFAAPRNERLRFINNLVGGWTFVRDGKLYREGLMPGSREEMIYLGSGQFRTRKEPAAEGVYFTDSDGTQYGCGTLACFRKTNPLWPVTRFILLAGSLLAIATSILFAFVWIPRKVFRRMKGVGHLSVRIVPLLASAALVATPLFAMGATTIQLAVRNWHSVGFFVGTIVFAILSLTGLVLAIRSFSYQMNRWARLHSLIVSIACCGITSYLAWWGMIGFRSWAW